MKDRNIFWQVSKITEENRYELNGHESAVIWLTGLSGSGKSTIAMALEYKLIEMKCHAFVLDGDNIRHGLCKDLSFSQEDRKENIRRIAEVSKLFHQSGTIVITSFISPMISDRNYARSIMDEGRFIEVYCNCSLKKCEERDVKGLYKKARMGVIPEFTGITSPYELPQNPELIIDTENSTVIKCVDDILDMLSEKGIVSINENRKCTTRVGNE